MRVLFTTPPRKKALYATAPLAGALHTAGHEVCVAAHPSFTRTISYAGLAAVPLGERTAESKADSPDSAETVRFAEYWRPDLIVGALPAAGGQAAAEATGAAYAQLLWKSDEDGDTTLTHFTIDQLPVCLRPGQHGHVVRMRHTPYAGPASIHPWLWSPPRRPRVALVPGSGVLAGLTESLADLDVEIVATNTEGGAQVAEVFPDNVRLGTSAPLATLVPTCVVIMHDGSTDTVATAALHGVPQLSLPSQPDLTALSDRIEEYGAGLHISDAERSGEQVRQALLRLLDEQSFAESATRLRAEMRAMPTANELVPHLEELTGKYRA